MSGTSTDLVVIFPAKSLRPPRLYVRHAYARHVLWRPVSTSERVWATICVQDLRASYLTLL